MASTIGNITARPNKNGVPTQVLIATQDAACRSRLRCALVTNGLDIVGESSDAHSLSELLTQLRPDILLLAPGMFIRESLTEALSRSCAPRIILMVPEVNKTYLIEALRLHARAIVPAASSPQLWLTSIRSVMAGHYWLNTRSLALLVEMARDLVLRTDVSSPPEDHGLTPRELEVVKMVTTGQSNKQIAYILALSERTVKHHLTSIFAKLGLSNRLELALFAHRIASHSAQSVAARRGAADGLCEAPLELPVFAGGS